MQINKNYEIEDLKWDTNFFEEKSAKVVLNNEIDFNDIKQIMEELKSKNYSFVTINNIGNNDINNFMLKNIDNIFLADVNIQFEKRILDKKENVLDKNILVQNELKYNNDIVNISKKSFIYSRFLNDKNLKNGLDVYVEWTKNAFDRKDKYFCIYKIEGKVIGFLLFSINLDRISIELIAVDSEYKGKGIGHKLINALEQFAMNNKTKYVVVGTQLNNIYAQNFYISCGFKHITNNTIYHLWLEEGKK